MRYGRWLSCIAAIAMAASPVLAVGPSSNAPTPAVFDVSISSNGQLVGQVLTSAGQADANKPVVLVSKRSAVAETQTDAQGVFRLPVTEAGVYRIAIADRSFTVRAWQAELAPPSARESLLCVTQEAVRGQYGCAQPACGAPAAYGPSCGVAGACPPTCGVASGACGPCGPAGGGCLGGGGLMSILTNPVVIGLGVATAIALPLALDDDDDDNNSGGNGGNGGSGEPTS